MSTRCENTAMQISQNLCKNVGVLHFKTAIAAHLIELENWGMSHCLAFIMGFLIIYKTIGLYMKTFW